MSTPPTTKPLTLDEVAAAITADLGTVAPDRRSGTIACRIMALLIRHKARGFEHLTQSEAAKMLGVSQSAVSRAGDRAEESLAVYRRGHRTSEVTMRARVVGVGAALA